MTVKGAALKAAAEGRFDELPIHNPSIECASRERIEAISSLALSTRLNGRITALRGIATKWTRWA